MRLRMTSVRCFSGSIFSKVECRNWNTLARKKKLLKENIKEKCISLLVLFYRFSKYQKNLHLLSSSSPFFR